MNKNQIDLIWLLFQKDHPEFCVKAIFRHSAPSLFLPKSESGEGTKAEKAAQKRLNELSALSNEDLDEACRAQNLNRQVLLNADHPLNVKFSFAEIDDYVHFARAALWTMEEAAALLLGRKPNWLNQRVIKKFPRASDIGDSYKRLLDLMTRAAKARELKPLDRPVAFLEWAARLKIAIPAELKWQISEINTVPPVPAIASSDSKANGTLQSNVAIPSIEKINPITTENDPRLGQRERTTLLKLVIGMAVAYYGFDPAKMRNAAGAQIKSDLEAKGFRIDEDTIRKYLNEAKMLLPFD